MVSDKHVDNFTEELTTLINRYSLEALGGDTPDYILAEYLTDCLRNFGGSVLARNQWHKKGA
jgi:hypothetical protein